MNQIEVVISCYYFQRRMCWMLSSLLEQEKVKIIPNIAFLSNDEGVPSTRNVIDYFDCMYRDKFGTRIKLLEIIDPNLFTSRGMIRNEQMQRIHPNSDYILFADCDHVYDPLFFYEFTNLADKHMNEIAIFSVARISHDQPDVMEDKIQKFDPYPKYVPKAHKEFHTDFKLRMTSNVAAGNCQMIQKGTVGEMDYSYTGHQIGKDGGIIKGSSKFGSDRVFKKRVGNIVKFKTVNNQYHLQHLRVDADGIDSKTQR